jgi:hypothetical protein
MVLYYTVKSLQYTDRAGHHLGFEGAIDEYPFAKARDFAVLVKCLQAAMNYLGNLQTYGVGTDVNCGECGHGSVIR